MNRIVILGVVAGTLLLPTHAAAKTTHYDGTLLGDPNGHVAFDVSKRKGKKRAKNFEAHSIPATCDSSADPVLVDAVTTGADSTKVKRNKFKFKVEDKGLTAMWKGKLKQRGKVVEGIVSIKGLIEVSGNVRDCVTGKLEYSGGPT